MGAKGAVEIIFRDDKGDPAKLAAREAEEYKAKFANPFVAGAARLHRRRDHAARDAQAHLPVAGDAARQEAREPVAQARQHPAVSDATSPRSACGVRGTCDCTRLVLIARDRAIPCGLGRGLDPVRYAGRGVDVKGHEHVQQDPDRQPRRDRLPRHQDRKRMGIATVAVYSEADATRCTSSWPTRPCSSARRRRRESYLRDRQDHRRLQADRRAGGASGLRLPVRERRSSPKALAEAGIVFIGPKHACDRRDGRQDRIQEARRRGAASAPIPGHNAAIDDAEQAVEDRAARSAIR